MHLLGKTGKNTPGKTAHFRFTFSLCLLFFTRKKLRKSPFRIENQIRLQYTIFRTKAIERQPDVKQQFSERQVKYRMIAEDLRRQIAAGSALDGTSRLPSLREIMRQFGVSNWTAQKAMRQLAAHGIVRSVRGSGTYPVQRKPEKLRTPIIGCSIRWGHCNLGQERLFSNLEKQVVAKLAALDCRIREIPFHEFPTRVNLKSYLEGLDGLLISGVNVDLSECSYLGNMKLPPCVVFHNEYILDLPVHQIVPDHMTGLRKMFREAKKAGLKKVYVVYGDCPNLLARRDACIKAAEEDGWPVFAILCTSKENIYKTGLRIASDIRGSLIFSTSDFRTFHLLKAFQDKGLRPNKDFHLVGDDDFEGLGIQPCSTPTVTEIRCNPDLLIERTVQMMRNVLKKNPPVQMIERIPTELVIRQSAFAK